MTRDDVATIICCLLGLINGLAWGVFGGPIFAWVALTVVESLLVTAAVNTGRDWD